MFEQDSMKVQQKEIGFEEKVEKKKGLCGILTSIGVALTKLKSLLIILKLDKFLMIFGSMLLMIWIYAIFFGWSFAVGFVLLIFVHEMGHWTAAKKAGLDVSVPVFIPFVGAVISMNEQPKDAMTEAILAASGPVSGSIGALVCMGIYFLTKQELFIVLAYTGFMFNAFNLIPIHPMDGGRMVSAISRKLWFIGIPVGIVLIIKFFNPIILLILILIMIDAYRNRQKPNKEYYQVPFKTRIVFALLYFGMIVALGIGITYIYTFY